MGKAMYIGVDGVARKVKKMYVGVDGVARKIKKAYIGVGGVARPFYSAERQLVFYGALTNLSAARSRISAASNPAFAVFAGGAAYNDNTGAYRDVDAYNENTVKFGTAVNLPYYSKDWATASVGNYALFADGIKSGNSEYSDRLNIVLAYDANMVMVEAPNDSGKYAFRQGGANEACAFFAGGVDYSVNSNLNVQTVRAYSPSLVKTNAGNLRAAYNQMGSASTQDYAFFAGGAQGGTYVRYVSAYDTNKVRHDADDLPVSTRAPGGAAVGDYVIFGGGYSYPSYDSLKTAYAYSMDLVRIQIGDLPYASSEYITASIGEFCMFKAETAQSVQYYNMGIYDANLVQATMKYASDDGNNGARATTIGSYAIFAGGTYPSGGRASATVFAYKVVDK